MGNKCGNKKGDGAILCPVPIYEMENNRKFFLHTYIIRPPLEKGKVLDKEIRCPDMARRCPA